MRKIVAIVCLMMTMSLAHAQTVLTGTTQEQPMSIEHGQSYLFPRDFSYAYFRFTSQEDGLLTLKTSKSLRIFANGNPMPIFGTESIIGIKAGEDYVFYNSSTWGDSITMEVSFQPGAPYLPLKLESVTPTDGSTYHTTYKEGNVVFCFNVSVNVEAIKAQVVLSDGSTVEVNNFIASEDYSTKGTIYTLLLADTYQSLLDGGRLKKGDTFRVELGGVSDKDFPENVYAGTLGVTFVASGNAVSLLSATGGSTLKSYYMPGGEDGIITLTFTGEVTCQATSAWVTYGDREAGTWVERPVPYTIEGNIVTWNLQGIHLNDVPADDQGLQIVTVYLRNICDTEGNAVEGNTVGSPGTVTFSYQIELVSVNIYADFLPVLGSVIDEVAELEIWISEGKYLTFDGVLVTYSKEGQTVEQKIALEQLRLENDPYSDTDILVYVPLKDIYFDAGDVTVELTGVMAPDGTSPEVKGIFQSKGKEDSSGMNPTIRVECIEDFPIYNLNGVPADYPIRPGIYLKKGKKMVIREVSNI